MSELAPNKTDGIIDYVEFPSSDLASTKAFFEGLLGWKFQDYGPEYTDFKSGAISGGFFKSDRSAKQDEGSALVVFKHSNLEQFQIEVESNGGKITKEIFSFPGGRRFHFTEPAGNEFAVWCPIES